MLNNKTEELKACQVHLPEWLWRQVGSEAKLQGIQIRDYVRDALEKQVRAGKTPPPSTTEATSYPEGE
jgi:hypothetical protein